ncbi:MAG: calcineurin-like phosphoesterase C-terminal domain-containing protein [Salinibacter sp.]
MAIFSVVTPSRRQFLKQCTVVAGGMALPGASAATPSPRGIEVTGRVTSRGSGLGGVSVTDGVKVVQTDTGGRFRFASSTRRPFVYLSVPSGYRMPEHETGTARFYQPIEAGSEDTVEATFDLQPVKGNDEQHAFLVLADPQMGIEAEVQEFQSQTVPDVQRTLRALGDRPAFGVGLGDLVFDNLSLFAGYEEAVRQMGIPFLQVVGNHDLNFDAPGDPGSTATFRRHFGPEYYSFDRGAVHYAVLDDVFWPGSDGFGNNNDDYLGHIDATQLAWLEQDLAFVAEGRTVIVFAHIPPLSTAYRRFGKQRPSPGARIGNREALYDLLAPFDAHIISGHAHENEHRSAAGPHEHVVGTVCGAWWTGPICHDGTPRGYAVYEVDGPDVQWRYKSTGHDADHQMRLYPKGADPAAPDEFIANVWDADAEWSVAWYEDGIRTGQMARRVGTDPMSRRLYEGAEKPEKNPWADPRPTGHLFYAPFNPEANRIRVEATDRFGRTYAERLDGSAE